MQLARAPRLLTYYPPDVNCAEFAKQDLRFDSLKLLDTRITEKLAREATTKSKGKVVAAVLVSLITCSRSVYGWKAACAFAGNQRPEKAGGRRSGDDNLLNILSFALGLGGKGWGFPATRRFQKLFPDTVGQKQSPPGNLIISPS